MNATAPKTTDEITLAQAWERTRRDIDAARPRMAKWVSDYNHPLKGYWVPVPGGYWQPSQNTQAA
jgi:hypothetical protein